MKATLVYLIVLSPLFADETLGSSAFLRERVGASRACSSAFSRRKSNAELDMEG